MKIGRNEKCPCGSGKKYKQCCLKSGKVEADRVDPGIAAARAHDVWEMAVLPIPTDIGEGPHSRATLVIVTAGRAVVCGELLVELSVELPDLAEEMARHLLRAVERTGGRPSRLVVDVAEVVDELASRLRGTLAGIEVAHGETRNAEAAWQALTENVFGGVAQHVVVTTTWGAWEQPEAWVRAMFAAAERYYRCRPWEHLDSDVDLVDVVLGDGAVLTASVMGSAGETQGLAVTTDRASFFDDMRRVQRSPGQRMTGEILAMSYCAMHEIRPAARREARRLNLPVAGPSAYPTMHAMGSRAGGLPRDRAERFLAVLEAFVECFEQEDAVGELLEGRGWQSADGAVRFEKPASRDEWPGEVDPDRLRSGRTLGAGADRYACQPFLGEPGDSIFDYGSRLESFGDWLESLGLAAATVNKHLANAAHLFEFIAEWAGVRPAALHEFDLRSFLYDWYPHKSGATETEAKSIHASLDKLFAHLEDELDLEFPWVPRLLRERETFRERWRTHVPGPFWDARVQDWRSVLSAHLDTLAMLPRNELGDEASWGDTMGRREGELYEELARRWLHWRDDAIDQGVIARKELLPQLSKMQRTWETSPHERFGRTPLDVIVDERRKRSSKRDASRQP